MSNLAKNQAQTVLEGETSGASVITGAVIGTWEQSQARYFTKLLWPSIILLTTITILPVIFLIVTSFTSWDLSRPGSLVFTGLRNYVRVFSKDPRFWNSVIVQVKLSLMTVPAQIIIGLGLAVFVREKIKNSFLIELARGVFIIPMVIPPIIAALIWKILFTPPVSILNYIVTSLGAEQLAWLGDPDLALVAIAVASVWEFFPFCFLLLYAGLLSLPEEPYEAAMVDGASRWQSFRYVTLPLLAPTLSIVLLFRLVDSIRSFPMIYVMTSGGPGFATEPTNFYAYQQAFSYSYIGYSSSMIVVVLAFTMVLTGLILRNIKWHRGD
jgi:multiple sugar transport system permease protein